MYRTTSVVNVISPAALIEVVAGTHWLGEIIFPLIIILVKISTQNLEIKTVPLFLLFEEEEDEEEINKAEHSGIETNSVTSWSKILPLTFPVFSVI